MKLLVKGKEIYGISSDIKLGVYDESFEKWALYDEYGDLIYYMIDDDFKLIENATLPNDYESGKYFYEDGEFVLNENWKPYIPTEERINELELSTSEQREINALLEEELVNTQIALTEQYEVNIKLEEDLALAQNEITELQLAICDLYELMG